MEPNNSTPEAPWSVDDHIRSISPVVRPDKNHRKRLRMMLQHGKSSRRQQHTSLALTAAAVLVMIFAVQNTDVGSDAFEFGQQTTDINAENQRLIDAGINPEDIPGDPALVFRNNFRNENIGIDAGAITQEQAEQKAELISEAFLANDYIIKKVTAFSTTDEVAFLIMKEMIINGKPEIVSNTEEHTTNEAFMESIRFRIDHQEEFDAKIEANEALYLGTEIRIIMEVPILFEKWSATFPEWGEVTAWKGKPLD